MKKIPYFGYPLLYPLTQTLIDSSFTGYG